MVAMLRLIGGFVLAVGFGEHVRRFGMSAALQPAPVDAIPPVTPASAQQPSAAPVAHGAPSSSLRGAATRGALLHLLEEDMALSPSPPLVLSEEVEYDALSIELRTGAERFARQHGRTPTDEELKGLGAATMSRLAELAGLRGRNHTVRGPCPGRCQGRGSCNYNLHSCVCHGCYAGHDCGECAVPCESSCGLRVVDKAHANGRCDCCTGTCVCTQGYFGDDCTGVRSVWDEDTQEERPTASNHGYRMNFGTGPAVCDSNWTTRAVVGSSIVDYCGFRECPNDCWESLGHGVCLGAEVSCHPFPSFGHASFHSCLVPAPIGFLPLDLHTGWPSTGLRLPLHLRLPSPPHLSGLPENPPCYTSVTARPSLRPVSLTTSRGAGDGKATLPVRPVVCRRGLRVPQLHARPRRMRRFTRARGEARGGWRGQWWWRAR